MRERADGLLACKVDHACTTGTYRFDLGPMVLNVAIPGDDQPSLAGAFRDPDFIVGIDLRDRARCPYPAAFDRATGVTCLSAPPRIANYVERPGVLRRCAIPYSPATRASLLRLHLCLAWVVLATRYLPRRPKFTCDAAAWCCAFINDRELTAGDVDGRVYLLRLELPEAKD